MLTDPVALVTNRAALLAFAHVATSALLVGGLVMAGVSAYHLRRGNDPDGDVPPRGAARGGEASLALFPTPAAGVPNTLAGAPRRAG